MDSIRQFITTDTVSPLFLTYAALAATIAAFILWRWLAGDLESHPIAKAPASRSRTLGLQQSTRDTRASPSLPEAHLKSQ